MPSRASPFISGLFLLHGVFGCASYTRTPLDIGQEASSIVEQKEVEGLYVAVKDLSPDPDSRRFFDRPLLDYGYVPVLVLLELDQKSDRIFDVRRDEIQLCLRDGRRLTTVDPTPVAEAVFFSHWRSFWGFLLIFPGFFVAASVNDANAELLEDYNRKGMKSVRINPNMRSFRSVLFFKIPDDISEDFTLEDSFIEFKVYRQGDGQSLGKSHDFPVHFGK